MDYNYVRMRNAASLGDKALTEHYRRLYEAKPPIKTYSVTLNYIIIFLALVSIVLGVYIVFTIFSEMKYTEALFEICKARRYLQC